MADRSGSDDLDLVVTAINVQYELGGNLAQTLEIIGETVRDRIRIKREIRGADRAAAPHRLSSWPLLPVWLGIVLFIMNPEYMNHALRPRDASRIC